MVYSAATLFFSFILLLSILGKASSQLTTSEQEQLVKAINRFRQHVANGQHPAANMQQIYWDDQLAGMAQRDIAKCECEARHSNTKVGVTVLQLQKDRHSVQDMIESMLLNSETLLYLMQASFHQIGCAINTTDNCGNSDETEFICYWYPQCGSIFNAYEEGNGLCWQYNSEKSEEYEGLCQLQHKPLDGNTCEHNKKATIAAGGPNSCTRTPNASKNLSSEQVGTEENEEYQMTAAASFDNVIETVSQRIGMFDDSNAQCLARSYQN